jgi:hypothetical protein
VFEPWAAEIRRFTRISIQGNGRHKKASSKGWSQRPTANDKFPASNHLQKPVFLESDQKEISGI